MTKKSQNSDFNLPNEHLTVSGLRLGGFAIKKTQFWQISIFWDIVTLTPIVGNL